ncbi:hypothetical protein B9Z45_07650 [Limnohabitans sp. 2KL-17]|uniref:flagellar hook-length control protein FliK n=1 Tax=Limnohabitans sp. 2KL-17 TaxID=1100704 RepID=UPI000D3CD53C|nr:flagellar hook-length control protein FliK [Limnohabitans sp. 2KL-17]PUE57955.1 hypothetical protein B9Z45_07650 [Limnohabitans sp. 2KL-17]
MTIALIDKPSRAGNSLKTDTLESKNDKDSRSPSSEFGQVMSVVMTPDGAQAPSGISNEATLAAGQQAIDGQALAEATPGMPGLFGPLGGDFLKAFHLGPHLNVITPESAVPDEQSLEAFARSQGLDETAVQWLMGSAPSATSKPLGLLSEASALLTKTPALGIAANGASSGAPGTVGAVGTISVSGATVAIDTSGALRSIGAEGIVGTSPITTDTSSSPASSAATPGDLVKGAAAVKPDLPITNSVLNSAALWAMAQQTEKARTASSAPDALTEAAQVQVNLMPPPSPAAIWMQRNALVIASAKEPVATKAGVSLSELDLTQAASPELLESLAQELTEGGAAASSGTHPTPLSGHAGHKPDMLAAARLDVQNSDANPSTPDAATAQRSENIQNLAEKMGQAVGQRILSEIEKGQWHLKISLRPATLGHIEVEMRMRSGEMDAVFTAQNAVTRELLQDGMSKLKDTLSQVGMDVASVLVGDGQTQKRGGESTPGQTGKSTNANTDDSKSTASQSVSAPRMKMGEDGWDVLV